MFLYNRLYESVSTLKAKAMIRGEQEIEQAPLPPPTFTHSLYTYHIYFHPPPQPHQASLGFNL